MAGSKRDEAFYERALARRVATVRLCLAFANLAVIFLDHTIPQQGTITAYAWAYSAATLFLGYALVLWVAVKRGRIRSLRALWVSPFLDICFGSVLIVFTNGYQSPFNVWLVYAVLHSGFSRRPGLPILVALLGLGCHCLIATIPQERPLDVGVFAVRTVYIFGVAALMASIGASLAGYSQALALGAEIGRRLGTVTKREEAVDVLMTAVARQIDLGAARIQLNGDKPIERGALTGSGAEALSLPLMFGTRTIGRFCIEPRSPLTAGQGKLLRLLCDHTAATLWRIQLADHLAVEAAKADHLDMLDRLHDSTVQTLVALDLRLETIRMSIGDAKKLAVELDAAADLSRQAVTQVRELLKAPKSPTAIGPMLLRNALISRWTGEAELDITPGVKLAAEQWHIAQMLVKEGLNNSKRHGGASRVSLRVFPDGDGTTICSLTNDGVTPQIPVPFGYGLTRLHEAAEQVGGSMRFEAAKPKGALLEVRFRRLPSPEYDPSG